MRGVAIPRARSVSPTSWIQPEVESERWRL